MRTPAGSAPPNAGRDHGLARAVHRRGVDEVDAGVERGVHGGDRLVLGRLAPDLTEPAPAERQAADSVERAETGFAHGAIIAVRHHVAHVRPVDAVVELRFAPMRAWQVSGGGEPIDVLHAVKLGAAPDLGPANSEFALPPRESACPMC